VIVNAWESNGPGDRAAERRAVVACDGCLPPQLMISTTAGELVASGWRFQTLESGRHLCPACRHSRRRKAHRRSPPEEHPALPNVVVVGAGKCGTSSLHSYLAAHPQIHMSEVKELKFFLDHEWRDRLETYASFFDGRLPIRGESSPTYALHPLIPGIPERIAQAIPDARLIFLVRDPVERTVSHFLERAQVWHRRSFERDLGDLADPYNVYIAAGSYGTQVERYMTCFPREQMLILDHADLLANRRRTLREVFRFVGADDGFWSPQFESVHNVGHRKVRWRQTGHRLARGRVAASVRRVVPARPRRLLFAPAKRLTTASIEPPVIDDGLRERLRAAYAPEVERLRELTGKEFPTWQL
jgi:hypothetical protein